MARVLGLHDYGIYTLIWTIVTFAATIQVPIAITPMMMLGAGVSERRVPEFFSTALSMQVAYSVAAVPIVTLAALPIVWGREDALIIVLALNVYVTCSNQYEYFRRYFYAAGQRGVVLLFDGVLYVILLGIVFRFVARGDATIGGYLLLATVPVLLLCAAIVRLYPYGRLSPNRFRAHWRRILKIARPLLLSNVAGFVSGHTFIYATALFLGAAEVGGIAASRNVLGPLVVLMMALENGMTREAVLRRQEGVLVLRAYTRKMTTAWVSIFAAYVVLAVAFGEVILSSVYGEAFARFDTLILWFGVASLMQVVSRIQAVRLRTEGDYEAIKAANLAAMWISLVVSAPLVSYWGLTGAMLAVLIQQSVILVFQIIPLRLDNGVGLLPLGLRQN